MEKWFLLFIGCLAVFWDLWKGKIPNALIVAGLSAGWCFQLGDKGIYGALDFFGGAIFPLLLLGILFYFRMFGAGDIKLFSVIGGFLGIRSVFACIAVSFLAGALISAFLMIRRRILWQRLYYFFAYISNFIQFKKWIPYRIGLGKECSFTFSIPVLFSLILYAGGVY